VVRLSKIYTKVGDGGRTMLGDGAMLPKHHARIEAYGSVDEANAALGVAAVALSGPSLRDLCAEIGRIQNELFDVGADLCVPVAPGEAPGAKLRVTPEQVLRLEVLIDHHNATLAPLNSFVLPGGSAAAAALHVARTAVRLAERRVSALMSAEPAATNPQTLVYLNRLSDLLFVLARVANSSARGGAGDVLWVPGSGRNAAGSKEGGA
jgi:cob(I)alamin adenosyltransferase